MVRLKLGSSLFGTSFGMELVQVWFKFLGLGQVLCRCGSSLGQVLGLVQGLVQVVWSGSGLVQVCWSGSGVVQVVWSGLGLVQV